MTLRNFNFDIGNHFIAMEYYRLILNRTFWVLITPQYLICIQANGAIAAEAHQIDLFDGVAAATTNRVLKSMIVRGDLQNPYSYLKSSYLKAIADVDLMSDEFLKIKANFRILRQDISNVYYDPTPKWGMGPYPHDGKIYIEIKDGKRKELIPLGRQSGQKIADWIMKYK